MADETRTPQKDPPEGSRKVIEHELERQAGKPQGGAGGSGKQDDTAKPSGGTAEKTESRH